MQWPRINGALVAVGIWAPVAVALLAFGNSRSYALAVAGLVTTAVVGGFLAPRAIASRGIGVRAATLFATIAVPVGSLLFGLLYAVGEGRSPTDAFGFALVGLLFLGVPMLILGTLLALIWVPLVRRCS